MLLNDYGTWITIFLSLIKVLVHSFSFLRNLKKIIHKVVG